MQNGKKENPDKHFQFVNDIFGGSIPREFVPAIQKGFETSMTTGVLAAYPVENMKVRVFDGIFPRRLILMLCLLNFVLKQGFREAGT